MRENPDKYITDEDIEILKDQVKNWSCFLVKKSFTCFPTRVQSRFPGEIKNQSVCTENVEANFHVVVGQMGSIRNIARCVREAGLEMEALTLEPLASSGKLFLLLKKKKRELPS